MKAMSTASCPEFDDLGFNWYSLQVSPSALRHYVNDEFDVFSKYAIGEAPTPTAQSVAQNNTHNVSLHRDGECQYRQFNKS